MPFNSLTGEYTPALDANSLNWGNNASPLNIGSNNVAPVTGNAPSWNSFQSLFGGTDANGMQTTGWVSPALGAAGSLAQSWLGFQNINLARDQLDFQRNAWQKQFDLQKEEYDYAKDRRDERRANYDASRAASL